jgi:two-component system chemotaxis response regulator CheY
MDGPDFKLLRVLVVDDQSTMRSIIKRLLKQGGITDVEEASDGEQALEILRGPRTKSFDLIISDLHMERLDGISMCNTIRRCETIRDRSVPIVILTGDDDDLLHEVVQQVGAVCVLTKPVSASELFAGIAFATGFVASAA